MNCLSQLVHPHPRATNHDHTNRAGGSPWARIHRRAPRLHLVLAGVVCGLDGSSTCTVCPIGRIITTSGDDGGCRLCPPGKINDDAYAADATLHDDDSDSFCDDIRFSSADRSQCVTCPGVVHFQLERVRVVHHGQVCSDGRIRRLHNVLGWHVHLLLDGFLDFGLRRVPSFPEQTLAVNQYTACAAMKSSRTQAADCAHTIQVSIASAAGQSTCTACSGGSATGQVSGATACSACLPGRQAETWPRGVPQLSARNLRDLERKSVLPGLFSGFLRERYRQHILHRNARPAQRIVSYSYKLECAAGTYADSSASSAC